MAYNPFDDVILNDPAYMDNGGDPLQAISGVPSQGEKVFYKTGRDYLISQGIDILAEDNPYTVKDAIRLGKEILEAKPGERDIAPIQPLNQEPPTTVPVPQFISEGKDIRETQKKLQEIEDIVPGAFYQSMQPVYEQRQQEDFTQQKKMIGAAGEYTYDFIVAEEAAARAKEKREKNKQILEELGFRLGNMNREQRAEAIARGFTPLTAGEALAQIPDYLFGDTFKAFRKMRKGEPLEAGEGYALLTVPLDILDFAGIGLLGGVAAKGTYKLIQRLKKKYFDEAGVPDIKSILDNQTYAFDPDVQEAKRIFGGSPLPLIQDAAAGPPGMPGTPRITLDVADRPGGGSNIQVPKKKTKLIDRPDDIKKIQEIIAEEKKKTGKEFTIVEAAALIKKKAPELAASNQSLSNLLKEGIDLGITNVFRPTKAETDLVATNANKLANIIKQNLPENEGLSSKELVEKYGFDNLLIVEQRNRGAQTGLKTRAKSILNAIPGYKEKQYAIRSKTAGATRRAATDPELIKILKDLIDQDIVFDSENALGRRLSVLLKGSRHSIRDRRNDPKFKPLLDILIQEPERGTQIKDVFFNTYDKIPMKKKLEFLGVKSNKLNDFDRATLQNIKQLAESQGIKKNYDVINLFRDFLQYRYRGIKDASGFENLTPEQFFKQVKYDPDDINLLRSEFQSFIGLEETRLAMQKEARDFLEELGNIPEYRKYLLDKNGMLDYKLVGVDKAHDTPLFVTRVEGKGRLKKIGRLLNTATEPQFLNPSFQVYNNMQVKFDPVINKLADLRQNKVLQNKAKKMDFTLSKKGKGTGDRLNFITEEFVALLNQRGANINLDDFVGKKQDKFLTAIDNAIDKIYKDRGIRTIVPVRIGKGGKKDFEYFGVPDMKAIPNEVRVELFKKKLLDELNYAVENNIPVDVFKNEGGYIRSLKDGGPVRMAIGGDPLTNLNQQQFSPDPAFEGEDYFQEAVDSGNLQAVNLLNLFKVFKKPKVMATPSNIKQVEQARDPMPQGVPGSQELQPMPAGRPDFFFKSYLLDQLNLPNAPKASTPQGWREFLIKGKKVPEAEMLDTGILQYLEDTEKFYPNKKITKQELEDLYDTSPLGNLEVRVKNTRRTVELDDIPQGENTRDFLDFNADQGRQKHKGAGNANIDEQADDYFEVVVNVPSLPGQERAFVNSSHFEEPNVLGFTRVGTYKNSNNETVAVIQEMQTDMLTEVRKEQERLFAMINALKRERAKLVDQTERGLNPDYYKNELRLFDQKYPPAKLEALETDNLIQPFPNVVAKDLIPERTANLNSIQEQINKLIMANVEQYNDPAYKTMVFDLAQQQNKIFEDLSSMNRSANYEESLRDFKVPSTADRNELNRIANTDEYLPTSYNLKQVQSFPPIPFNKQADYVDLLIKSTIKAAKGKGINKVAIMPANVGANPRWGKSSEEAKKKFENLYDKVGVQQLKNIAKKYGGTLEIEKIVDPSKSGKGLTFLNKNPDGEFETLKQIEPRRGLSNVDRDKFLDEEIARIASNAEAGEIVLTREISPGQFMDYYVVEGPTTSAGYRLIPLKEGENVDVAMIKIIEYNPSEIDMYTISFDPSKLEEPMYLFKKKSGGSIDKDSLVSITDIYGEYGR